MVLLYKMASLIEAYQSALQTLFVMITSYVLLTSEQKILKAAVDSRFALIRAHQHCIAE